MKESKRLLSVVFHFFSQTEIVMSHSTTKINENTTHVRHMTQLLEDFDGCYLPLLGNQNLP